MSVIQRPPFHCFECLWRPYFRTRNNVALYSHVNLCCLRVVATRHEPSRLLTPLYGAGVLDMYVLTRLQVINTGIEEQVNIAGCNFMHVHLKLIILF